MPLDAIYLSALTNELAPLLKDGKIDKVQQPERDTVLITLRSQGENRRLLLCAGNGRARVHFTSAALSNPSEPPMFCMLLRKHLIGARILNVYQPEGERVFMMELKSRDEMGFETDKTLVLELIGRSSNLILCDGEGRIIDCIRRMDFAGSAERCMLPGMIYRLPPKQDKPWILTSDSILRKSIIDNFTADKALDKSLLEAFAGLSPLICRELSYRCDGDKEKLPMILDAFCESIEAGELEPYVVFDGNKPLDFSFMFMGHYGDAAECTRQESFSAALECFYAGRDRAEQRRRRSQELTKSVKTLRDRQQRKLSLQKEELKATYDRENIRKQAELITANIYRVKKGDRLLRCEDYYQEDCPEIEIGLDPLKSPQQNAAAKFKEYNKLKAANEHLTGLIEEGEKKLDYLNSVMEFLSSAETDRDLADIKAELVQTGIIKSSAGKKTKKEKAQAPLRFMSDDGMEILVGRSNIQNDELTTKIGRRTDYWLHTQKIHGSHVIIQCDGERPSDDTLYQAAVIAAYYSQGRDGGKIPVDYTMLRFVKKPSGSLPGKVIYTDYSTIMAESDEELVRRLKK